MGNDGIEAIYEAIATKIDEVGKMGGSWQKKIRSKQS